MCATLRGGAFFIIFFILQNFFIVGVLFNVLYLLKQRWRTVTWRQTACTRHYLQNVQALCYYFDGYRHTIFSMKKSENFIKGALVLSLGGLLAKILGALYRIPLTNILGSYGMGLYQLVFPPYILMLTLAQAGVPVALSKLTSESLSIGDETRSKKVFRFSFVLLLVLGGAGAILMAGLSNVIAGVEGNAETATAFVIVAPALLFVPVTNVLKGYFQGRMNMLPSGITTVIEQIVKLVCGLTLANYFMPDVKKAVYGAVLAITISEFCSLVIMSAVYLVHVKKNKQLPVRLSPTDKKQITQSVMFLAVPVALGGFVMQMSQVIDSVMVVNLLTVPNATGLYGLWTGPVNSMLGLPIALSSGIAVSVLPGITKTYVSGDKTALNASYNSALKLTVLIAMPCAFGLILLSKPILSLLYGALPADEIYVSALMLSISGLSVVFLAVMQTCVSVCQAVNKPYASVIILAFAIVVKAVINLVLLPISTINIYGASISETMCYLFATVCVIIYLKAKVGLKINVNACVLVPLAGCFVMTLIISIALLLLPELFANGLGTIVLIALSAVAYFVTLIALKAFDKTELLQFVKKHG